MATGGSNYGRKAQDTILGMTDKIEEQPRLRSKCTLQSHVNGPKRTYRFDIKGEKRPFTTTSIEVGIADKTDLGLNLTYDRFRELSICE